VLNWNVIKKKPDGSSAQLKARNQDENVSTICDRDHRFVRDTLRRMRVVSAARTSRFACAAADPRARNTAATTDSRAPRATANSAAAIS
jgi:hypothetical protein